MLKFTPKRRLTGGVRLPANKLESTARPIARGLIPPRLIISLNQQRNATVVPVVRVGQAVARGETIARSESPEGADLHAPTSGTIAAIENHQAPLTALTDAACIVIDTDGADRPLKPRGPIPIAETDEERLQQIVAAGIVGLGGAVYPTAAKLKKAPDQQIRLLIINGAECEPYISCDDMLMREAPEEIIEGAEILRQLVGAPECVIAIERDKPQAIDAMTAAAEKLGYPNLKIAELPSIYPAGGERQLVEVLTGIEVPSSIFPGDVGVPCQNVGTAFAVYRYFRLGEPLTSRIVTVTGAAIAEPQNIEAMIGTPIRALVDACGGYRSRATRLIQGGSMMGFAIDDDRLPITKASNCIIAAESFEIHQDRREWPCIRCGECSIACPVRLQPQDLVLAARASDAEALTELALSECIECGCCDIVCPSHIPLTQVFRTAKPLVAGLARQKAFSEASNQRYQQHEQRRHEKTAADNQRRDEIKRTLGEEQQRADEINAAVARARLRRSETDGS